MLGSIVMKADEINCLIHAYLKDSGFQHTAFSLRNEAHLDEFPTFKKHIPYGELVELLGKSLLYVEVEKHWAGKEEMVTNCIASFSLLEDHVCNIDPMLKPTATIESALDKRNALESGDRTKQLESHPGKVQSGTLEGIQPGQKEPTSLRVNDDHGFSSSLIGEDGKSTRLISCGKSELFCFAWNPKEPHLFASGSKDGVVHLKHLPQAGSPNTNPRDISLKVGGDTDGDLTSLDWNGDGSLLAISSYDHKVRVITASGQLYMEGVSHKGPVFSAKFSKNGRWLVSAALDNTTCLWNVAEKKLHNMATHAGCCLDLEWLSNEVFAFCGSDNKVHVLHIGDKTPYVSFIGHMSEVNTIRANPSYTLLASCSDDYTARIWNVASLQRGNMAVEITQHINLSGHTEPVNSLGWTRALDSEILVTSSFDCTSRIWNANTGACLKVFTDHSKPVFSLGVNPRVPFVATGGSDGWLHMYDMRKMERVWSWRHSSTTNRGAFDMVWKTDDARRECHLALALETGEVCIIDANRIPAIQ